MSNLINRYNHAAFINGLKMFGEGITTFLQTLIVYFGGMIALLFVVVVEQQRIQHGMSLFEKSASLASFAAWSLVIAALTIEFMTYHIEAKANYHHENAYRSSLRISLRKLSYWLGLGQHWQPQALSPAEPYRKLQRLLTFAILVLALAGSMKPAMQAQGTVTWFDALWNILAKSTLLEMSTWLGGLLFAFAAVMTSQKLTAYLAIRTAEILAEMEAKKAMQGVTLEAAHSEGDTEPVMTVDAVLEVQPDPVPLRKNKGRHSLAENG